MLNPAMSPDLITFVTTDYYYDQSKEASENEKKKYFIVNRFSGEDAERILSGTFQECLDSLLDTGKNPKPAQDIADQILWYIEKEREFMKFSPFRDDGRVIPFYCLDLDDNAIVKNGQSRAYLNSKVRDYAPPIGPDGRNILALDVYFFQRGIGA